MITGGDVRFCTEDSKFSLKEIDIGIVADIGAFPRLPLIMGNESFVRERLSQEEPFQLTADKALKFGLVSKVFKTKEDLLSGLKNIAEEISSKSPVAIYAIKKVMNKLEYVALMNMSMQMMLVKSSP